MVDHLVALRGEIWWANLPRPRGSEPGYRRPVVIVQSDKFNRSSIRTVMGAVLTSNLTRAAAPGNVELSKRDTGLPKKSVVNVSQVLILDKALLAKRVGTLTSAKMEEVANGLRLALALMN